MFFHLCAIAFYTFYLLKCCFVVVFVFDIVKERENETREQVSYFDAFVALTQTYIYKCTFLLFLFRLCNFFVFKCIFVIYSLQSPVCMSGKILLSVSNGILKKKLGKRWEFQ